MKRAGTIHGKRRAAQRGYAFLMVVFVAALMLVVALSASLSAVTEGKREKEKEMIWRGNQYVRGIKLYYRKFGRFPAEVDDLTKAKTGSLRFLRQAYKDPMNKADGTWRFIYVGPAGQLVGSLKPHPVLQLPAPGGAPGNPGGASAAPGGATSGTGGSAAGAGQTGAPGAAGSGPGTSGAAQGGDAAGGQGGQNAGAPDLPPGNVDSPTVFGGKIIGVGSKIDGRSVIVYDKARNYRLFEFIWDPSKDTGGSSQPLRSIPGGSAPGQPSTAPASNPGTPPANPNPNP